MFIIMSLHQSTADLKNRREAPWKHRQIDSRSRKRHQQPPKRRFFRDGWLWFIQKIVPSCPDEHLLCFWTFGNVPSSVLFDQLSVAVFGGSRRRMISVQLVRCYSKQIHWVVVDRHRETCHEILRQQPLEALFLFWKINVCIFPCCDKDMFGFGYANFLVG